MRTRVTREKTLQTVSRWAKVEDFAPTSPKQILEYLKYKGYKIPKDRASKKDTTGEEALIGIALSLKKLGLPPDPLLEGIITARKYRKAASYLGENYLSKVDGRLHPQFTFLPDTGRLSSRAPNLQNVPAGKSSDPVEKKLAEAIRRTIIPTKGMVLLELDWKAIEALLVGFFARDPGYIRVSLMDPHSYLASYLVGKPADLAWDDGKLGAYLKQIKKDHYFEREYLAKRANHSDGYGIGSAHLAEVLESDVKTAKWVQEMRAKAFPKVHAWKEDTRRRAHGEGRLMTPFGYIRCFFEVFRKGKDGLWRLGKEANEALAFLPQSTAAAMMRQALLEIASLPEHGKIFWLLLSIHDSIVIECLPQYVDEVLALVKGVMERPWRELEGLRVETDAKVGECWAEMKEVK